jgi:proteasome lid subunit RPN8/RPN11
MTIEISSAQLKIIFDRAEAIYPEECCGILLGKFEHECKTAIEVIPTINDWQGSPLIDEIHRTKHSRYIIPPQEIFRAQNRGRDLNLEIIGFFHSHPDYPAIPSECDRVQAWEIYSYPIVSVIQGQSILRERGYANEIKSWVLDKDRVFRSEEIRIVGVDGTAL